MKEFKDGRRESFKGTTMLPSQRPGLLWLHETMYLPGIHFLEESVQVIRSVKDVTQRTDCECEETKM